MDIDANKSAKENLIDFINLSCGTSFVVTDLNFGAPVNWASVPGDDTKVVVAAANESLYSGVLNLTYARLDLSVCDPYLRSDWQEGAVLSSVLTDLLNQAGVIIDDVILPTETPVFDPITGQGVVEIQALSTSLIYKGVATAHLYARPTMRIRISESGNYRTSDTSEVLVIEE